MLPLALVSPTIAAGPLCSSSTVLPGQVVYSWGSGIVAPALELTTRGTAAREGVLAGVVGFVVRLALGLSKNSMRG